MNNINACQIMGLTPLKEPSWCGEIGKIMGGKSQLTRKQKSVELGVWTRR